MYKETTNSAFKQLEQLSKENAEIVSIANDVLLQNIINSFDLQVKIASYFVGWWSYDPIAFRGKNGLHKLLLSSFHKNIFDYFSAIKLTRDGLYGSAQPLLRKIFEWLMIAKFANISENTRVLDKWNQEETVYFSNSILKKITIPNPEPFYEFWGIVCDSAHAAKSSGQPYLKIDDEMSVDVKSTLVVLAILLECSYHLLNSQLITPQFAYMAKFYCSNPQSPRKSYNIPEFRKQSHDIFKSNRVFFTKDSVRLINAYKRKWIIK